jgi:hypothetical protein
MTCHAAVVARSLNKAAVVGVTDLKFNESQYVSFTDLNGVLSILNEGDVISIDGSTGRVWGGEVPVSGGAVPGFVDEILDWALETRNLIKEFTVRGDSLPSDGRFYLNLRHVESAKGIRAVFKKLGQNSALYGIIGLEAAKQKIILDSEDREYVSFFGLEVDSDIVTEIPDAAVSRLVTALQMKTLPRKLRKRWVVHLPSSVTEDTISIVSASGWSVVREVRSLADLVMARGIVRFDSQFMAQLQQDKVNLPELYQMFERAGRGLRPMPGLILSEDAPDEVLGT